MPARDNKAAINILLQTLEMNPELWETRKKTAEILYDEEQYVEAAEILWSAPDIPSTDTDIAFTIKIISRAKPNRAIRLIYEMVRRNNGKPAKNMAVASALNDIGMYMQAARFYGAALANIFMLPVANKIKFYSANETLIMNIIVAGVLGIVAGENPRVIREKLDSFLPPAQRQVEEAA
mgnify:CR=1 FL=1